MKRIISSLLCVCVCFCVGVLPVLASEGASPALEIRPPRYNLKLNMDTGEFTGCYGYSAGTSQGEPKPSVSNTTGKYGTALSLKVYGYQYSGNRYNAIVLPLTTDKVSVGDEQLTYGEFLREAHTLSFWLKTPPITQRPGLTNSDHREIALTLETSAGKFSKTLWIYNETGDWQYVTLPFAQLVDNGKKLSLADAVQAGEVIPTAITFALPYGKYYAANPDESTIENPWLEPACVDDMLFDRSTPENPAIIPPSKGEEAYSQNADIVGVTVDGAAVAFDPSAEVNTIPVPAGFSPPDVEGRVAAVVAAPSIEPSSRTQAVSGATFTVSQPETIPGEGTITVRSADMKTRNTYRVRYVQREGFQVYADQITGVDLDAALPSGETTITIPVGNEQGGKPCDAAVLAVARDRESGAAACARAVEAIALQPDEKRNLSVKLTFPEDTSNLTLTFYFVDTLETLRPIYPAVSSGSEAVTVVKDSTAKLTDLTVKPDREMETVTLSGSVLSAVSNENAVVAVWLQNEDGAESLAHAFAPLIQDGAFQVTYSSAGSPAGIYRYAAGVGGMVLQRTAGLVSKEEAEACVSAFHLFNEQTADQDLIAYVSRYRAVLALPKKLYDQLSAPEQADAVRGTVKAGANSLEEIQSGIMQAVVLASLNRAGTLEDMRGIFDGYREVLQFDTGSEYYQTYITSSSREDEILEKMVNSRPYSSISAASGYFAGSALVVSLRHASYTEVGSLLNQNRTQIGSQMDYAKYDKLTGGQKTDFWKVLTEADLRELSDLGIILEKYVKAIEKESSKNSSSASSGGGGGRGGQNNTPAFSVNNTAAPTASPEPEREPQSGFSDLGTVEWAREAIEELARKGIVTGKTADTFEPEANVTREEFAKMIVLALGLKTEEAAAVKFTDVDPLAWYAGYIGAAVEAGITTGKPDGSFGIGEEITRQDIAVMASRALENAGYHPGRNETAEFADEPEISDYARDGVYALCDAGIVNGIGENLFAPRLSATRAEAAKIIAGLCGCIEANR